MSVVVTPIGVKVCKMVEPCPRTIFSASVSDILGVIKCEVKKGARFGWTIFWLLRHRFCDLTANITKTVSQGRKR